MKQVGRRILSIVLAATMLLSPGTVSFAADTGAIFKEHKDVIPLERYDSDGTLGNAWMEDLLATSKNDGPHNLSFCLDATKDVREGPAVIVPITDYLTQAELTTCALYMERAQQLLPDDLVASYAFSQILIWELLNEKNGWGRSWKIQNDFIGYDTQEYYKNEIRTWVEQNKHKYIGYGEAYDNGGQPVGRLWVEPLAGDLEIRKSSSNPSITNGNDCYSLEGAVYQLLDGSGGVAATLTTDAGGYARVEGITPGSYTLKEVTAPRGYLLDDTPIPVTIASGQTTNVPVTDQPGNDPTSITLQKVDKETGDTAQAGASLAGAQFTIKYYAGYYDKNSLPVRPTRTWVIETKEVVDPDTGKVRYYAELNDSYKVSGDEFYRANGGTPTLPLGTVTIEETKAPDGYLLEGAYLQPSGGGQKVEGVFLSQIIQEGNLVRLQGGNTYTMTDSIIRGGVKVQKLDADTGTAAPQGDATLAGARFDIINLNDSPVHVDGKTYASGETVMTLTTDETGLAQTAAGALPAGHYKVMETTPPDGYLHDGVLEREFDITENGVLADLTTPGTGIQDKVIKGSILIVKHTDDGETGIETPEEGARFQVYLKSAGSYEAARETERDVIICDEDGFAQTKDLPYGTYIVHQTRGWPGRDLVEDFEVRISSDGQVYRYIINNQNFESYLKVIKTDAETGKSIAYAGAGFQIYDPEGNLVTMEYTYPAVTEVDTFYTAEDGSLMTPERLPYGTGYTLVEVQAPYGYVLDSTPVEFDVAPESAGKEDGYTVIRVTRSDQPQKGTITIEKTGEVFATVKVQEGEPENRYQPVYAEAGLEGAVFEIRAAEDIHTLDGTLRYAEGELVDTLTTSADGTAESRELYLGRYEIRETKAPHGMVKEEGPIPVTLQYAGQEVSVTSASVSVPNERQKVLVKLLKELEKDDLFQFGMNGEILNVRFALYAAEELTAADGTVIPKEGLIEIAGVQADGALSFAADLPPGSYHVREYAGDEHYLISGETYPVVFEYSGEDTAVVELFIHDGAGIENHLIRGEISGRKTDDAGEPLPGAVFGLFAEDCTEFTEETAILTTTSTEDGSFHFEKVPYGVWKIRELKSPEGYVLTEEIFEVQVDEDGQVIEIGNIENRPVTGELEITKTDIADGKLLPDAGFRIKDENGNVVAEGYTDENGIARFTLEYGKYTYEEFAAPEGYQTDTTPHAFEIREDGEIVRAEMTNEKIPAPEVPKTGDGPGTGLWIGLGAAALGGLISFVILKKKGDGEDV